MKTSSGRLAVVILLVILVSLLFGCDDNGVTQPSTIPVPPSTSPISSPSPTQSVSPSPTITPTLPPGIDLMFEEVLDSGDIGGLYTGRSAQINIITTDQLPQPKSIERLIPEHRVKILEVDYSQYLVIVVFNGWRSSIGINTNLNIQRIWIDGRTVSVRAHFDDGSATVLPLNSSQYKVVKILKKQLPQQGEIAFKLVDDSGHQRAATSANLTGS